jgi:hypothetical protein
MSDRHPRLLDAVAAQLVRAVGGGRGVLVQAAHRCGGCRVLGKPTWRFARVDGGRGGGGELWLCPRCKVELESRRARGPIERNERIERRERERATYVDAMERAVLAGAYEANRRRH